MHMGIQTRRRPSTSTFSFLKAPIIPFFFYFLVDSYTYKCEIGLFQQILWILMNIDLKHNLESTNPDGLICESCQEIIGVLVRDRGQVSRVRGLGLTVSSGSGPCLQFWVVFVTPLGVVAVGPAVATFWNIGKRRRKHPLDQDVYSLPRFAILQNFSPDTHPLLSFGFFFINTHLLGQ